MGRAEAAALRSRDRASTAAKPLPLTPRNDQTLRGGVGLRFLTPPPASRRAAPFTRRGKGGGMGVVTQFKRHRSTTSVWPSEGEGGLGRHFVVTASRAAHT